MAQKKLPVPSARYAGCGSPTRASAARATQCISAKPVPAAPPDRERNEVSEKLNLRLPAQGKNRKQ